jgi:hypothetical protein
MTKQPSCFLYKFNLGEGAHLRGIALHWIYSPKNFFPAVEMNAYRLDSSVDSDLTDDKPHLISAMRLKGDSRDELHLRLDGAIANRSLNTIAKDASPDTNEKLYIGSCAPPVPTVHQIGSVVMVRGAFARDLPAVEELEGFLMNWFKITPRTPPP